jgi:flagellar motor switch protein FliN/FliY
MRNPFAEDSGFQDWLGAQWADSLRLALENMSATAIPVEPAVSLESGANPGSDWLWLQQALTQAPHCPMWVGAPAITWRRIAERILEAAGVESGEGEEIRRTYVEVVQHSFNTLASALSGVLGREVASGPSNVAPAAPPLPWLQFTLGADLGTPIFLAFASTLRDSLAVLAAPPRTEGSLAQLPATPPKAPGVASKIEVLYEVELPVSISFGHAQLPLRDVLKLATGSIVELNRTVSEPVDIVVNNCIIARGEVVVVDGNYGVKILEIVNHNERLRSLR